MTLSFILISTDHGWNFVKTLWKQTHTLTHMHTQREISKIQKGRAYKVQVYILMGGNKNACQAQGHCSVFIPCLNLIHVASLGRAILFSDSLELIWFKPLQVKGKSKPEFFFYSKPSMASRGFPGIHSSFVR